MEFERAIYRVYERCMDGLREEQDAHGNANMKSCKFLEILSLCCGGFLLAILFILHSNFVGSPGCLPDVLSTALGNTTSIPGDLMKGDQILYITIDPRFRPDKNIRIDDDTEDTGSAMINHPIHLRSTLYTNNKDIPWTALRPQQPSTAAISRGLGELGAWTYISNQITSQADETLAASQSNSSTYSASSSKNETATEEPVEPSFDYKFTFNSGLLMLPYRDLVKHGFATVNVSLLGSACYGSSFTQGAIPVGGVDNVVLNALMYTFNTPGHVLTSSGEYFRWTAHDVRPYTSIIEWVQFKLQITVLSVLAFFLLTTITALMVRILISSGVVLIFPVFWVLQLLGFAPLNLRVVAISYPWIGVPLEMIRGRSQSAAPFLLGHMSRVLVYYFLYQSTQIVFAVWFYNRDSPGHQELWIFGVMMLWEYYSMIYVRSSGSIQLFPRAALALFLIYHFYYFSYPGGFHLLALVVMFFFLLTVMVHCIRVFEIKDYERGYISLDQPRALYNSLPFPVWNGDLAPEYTLMMPLTHRSQGAYQTAIPNLTGNGAGPAPSPNAGPTAPGATGSPLHDAAAEGADAGRQGEGNTPVENNSAAAEAEGSSAGGIELGRVQRSVLGNMLSSVLGSGQSRGEAGAGAQSRPGVAYSRLENQSSTHGAAERSHDA